MKGLRLTSENVSMKEKWVILYNVPLYRVFLARNGTAREYVQF